MKTFILILSLLCAAVAFAQAGEKQVRLSGVLSQKVFPGPPNYESVGKGDAAEKAWILTVARDTKQEEFQLVVSDSSKAKVAALRRSIGKKITIVGSMWEAQTGHHHTPFLVTVSAIEKKPNKAHALDGGKPRRLQMEHHWPATSDAHRSALHAT
jgi:hypothetical protein